MTPRRVAVTQYIDAVNMYDAAYHRDRGNDHPYAALQPPPMVSLLAYLHAQAKRTSTGMLGSLFFLAIVPIFMFVIFHIICNVGEFIAAQPTYVEKQMTTLSGQIVYHMEEVKSQHPLPPDWVNVNLALYSEAMLAMSLCSVLGLVCFRRVQKIDPGIPLTRANTSHLPASESLVRASMAPSLEQPHSLLRSASWQIPPAQMLRPAACSGQTPVEQLVRSSHEQS